MIFGKTSVILANVFLRSISILYYREDLSSYISHNRCTKKKHDSLTIINCTSTDDIIYYIVLHLFHWFGAKKKFILNYTGLYWIIQNYTAEADPEGGNYTELYTEI